MATERKKNSNENTDFPGGGMNSEHESDTAGMHRSAKIENPHNYHEFDEDENRAVRKTAGGSPEEVTDGDRKSPVHNLSTTSKTDFEREIEKKGRMTARTPYEMSQHDRINRSPGKTATPKKSATPEKEKE